MGDLVSPIVMTAVVACIGLTEGIKKKFSKLSSTWSSIIGGAIGAFGVSNLNIDHIFQSVQSFVLNWFIIVCVSWLAYEMVVKRFTTPATTYTTPAVPTPIVPPVNPTEIGK